MSRMAPAGTEHQLAGMLRAVTTYEPTLCVLHDGYEMAEDLASEMPVVQMSYGSEADPRRAVELRRLARGGAYDVVHSSLWGTNAYVRAALAGPGRPPTVISERRVEDFRRPAQRRLDAALRPLTDGFIGNSVAVCDFVSRAHGVPRGDVAHIPNGIDGSVFHPGPRDRHEVPRLGCLGRLVPQKGFDTALAAFRVLAGRRAAELHLAGQGPEREALERSAADLPVTFRGQLSTPEQVAGFLRELDVLVAPSRYEGLPNVVLEALACGTSVVAADAPGVGEATGGRARLVDVDDPAALADALEEVLDGRWAPQDTGPSPAQSFSAVAEQHHQVFERAVHRRSRG